MNITKHNIRKGLIIYFFLFELCAIILFATKEIGFKLFILFTALSIGMIAIQKISANAN